MRSGDQFAKQLARFAACGAQQLFPRLAFLFFDKRLDEAFGEWLFFGR